MYNNWNYNPYYQQPQQQNPDERIWVQGIESAKAYLVAPNGFVRLWDANNNVFYEKRADNTGRPYMEVFEYKRQNDASQVNRLDLIEKRLSFLEGAFNERSDANVK